MWKHILLLKRLQKEVSLVSNHSFRIKQEYVLLDQDKFTELLWIDQEKFLHLLSISESDKDVNWKQEALIELRWYVCGMWGHYSMDWEDRWKILGNLKRNLQSLQEISEEEKNKYSKNNPKRTKRKEILWKDMAWIENIKAITEGKINDIKVLQKIENCDHKDSSEAEIKDEEFKRFSLSSKEEDSLNQSVRNDSPPKLSTFARNKNKTELSNGSKLLFTQFSASLTSEIKSKDNSWEIKKEKMFTSSKRMLAEPSILIKQFTGSERNSN